MEEHQEAMRREQLAQELAEAEAAAAEQAAQQQQQIGDQQEFPLNEDAEEEDDGIMERDLDEEIPEAGSDGDEAGLGYSIGSDESPSSPSSISEEEEHEDREDVNQPVMIPGESPTSRRRRAEQERTVQNLNLRAARMGMNDDALREVVAASQAFDDDDEFESTMAGDGFRRGLADPHADTMDGDEDDEGATNLFEEEDLVHDDDNDMEHDLDDEIPDADEDGGREYYEHTDSDADITSSMEGEEEEGTSMDGVSYQYNHHYRSQQQNSSLSHLESSFMSQGRRSDIDGASSSNNNVQQPETRSSRRRRNQRISIMSIQHNNSNRYSMASVSSTVADLNSILSAESSLLGSSPIVQRMPGPERGQMD